MGKLTIFVIASLLLSFITNKLAAKDFSMLHYSMESGLPSNTIYYVYKDSKGYLWLCSDKGVVRFNGIEFERFTTFDGLPDNDIFFVKEDYYGRLWLSTFNGELCYYKDGIFHTAENTPFLRMPFKKSYIQDIIVADDSSVVMGFYDYQKWVIINKDVSSIRRFEKFIAHSDTKFLYLKKKKNGRYHIVFTDRVYILDSNLNIVSQTGYVNNRNYKYSVSQNQEYLYTKDSVYTLAEVPLAAMNRKAFKAIIYHVYIYDGNVFYCTDKGLFINNDIHAFKDHKVSAVETDILGNYWISTLGGGVYTLHKNFLSIDKYTNCYDGQIKYAHRAGNNIFFASDNNSVYRFNTNNGEVKCLYTDIQHTAAKKPPAYQSFILDKHLNFYCFNDTNIRVLTAINSNHPVVKKYKGSFVGGYKGLFADGRHVFLKRFRGIDYVDFSQSSFRRSKEGETFSSVTLQPYILGMERIFGMAQDKDDNLWYSTIDSLYKINNGKPVAQPMYKNIAFKWFNIFDNYLVGCTHDNRLAVCNRYDSSVIIDIAEGYNCIWNKLYRLDSTHILAATSNLYRIITLLPSAGKPIYTIETIESPYIPLGSEEVCSDGNKCFFFKNGSITAIDIQELFTKAQPPVLSFKTIKTRKKIYNISSDVDIPYNDARNISIAFSTLSFGGKDVKYQYTVSKNEEDSWTDLQGDINIIQPSFGDYVVKVRAKSISSGYSKPIVFTLHILKPFWATWWFLSLSVPLIVLLAVVMVRYRISSVLHKKQKLHENEIRFIKSEYKAMNALMNPHFIFNTLNNVQDLINTNDKRAANEYLRFFADLIRQNMHNVSRELVSLQKEMDLVVNYLRLEKLRFEDCLNYNIDMDDDIDLSEIMIPPLLIQPLVENAIKHGIYPLQSSVGQIRICIYEKEDVLYIEVKDNGIGLEQSKNNRSPSHESFGLQSIEKRIEQLNIIQNKKISFRIDNINTDGRHWTVITICMPLSE